MILVDNRRDPALNVARCPFFKEGGEVTDENDDSGIFLDIHGYLRLFQLDAGDYYFNSANWESVLERGTHVKIEFA